MPKTLDIHNWKTVKRHPLSEEYKDIEGAKFDRMVDRVRRRGVLGGRTVKLVEEEDGRYKVIDGWQLYRACIEAQHKPDFELVKDDDLAEYVEIMNDDRRHETPEEAAGRIAQRRDRVLDARAEGKSIRTIAAEEDVSRATVQGDLKAAGGQGLTPAPGKVKGADGKTYEAKPLFCPRCTRVGPVKDCEKCAELRKKKKPKPERQPGDDTASEKAAKKKARDNGKVKYDWRLLAKNFGPVCRAPDAIAKAYGAQEKQSKEFKDLGKALDEAAEVIAKWKKRLQGGK